MKTRPLIAIYLFFFFGSQIECIFKLCHNMPIKQQTNKTKKKERKTKREKETHKHPMTYTYVK